MSTPTRGWSPGSGIRPSWSRTGCAEGRRDFRRLTGLLNQPLAALNGDNYAQPVWHCALRAAPEDRVLSDAEWAPGRGACHARDRAGAGRRRAGGAVGGGPARPGSHPHCGHAGPPGPAPAGSVEQLPQAAPGVPGQPRNGSGCGAPPRRIAPPRSGPRRAESEQAIRRGWDEPPRTWLRREVCTAAAGARTEDEFFAQPGAGRGAGAPPLQHRQPGEVTGYAVGMPGHTGKDGQVIWYGGGKLAADLTLPKLRARWGDPAVRDPLAGAASLPAPVIRGVLRATVAQAAASRSVRRSSSPGCAPRACWCGSGSARSTRVR